MRKKKETEIETGWQRLREEEMYTYICSEGDRDRSTVTERKERSDFVTEKFLLINFFLWGVFILLLLGICR